MSTSEKFCLKWNDFHENINATFGCLRDDTDLADVTLACEDGQQVEAHKVILAASSPFFQNLLKRNKHAHPLIYMRGMKSENLVALVDFLYLGKANIYQENLDSFLALAEELKLKGLTGDIQETQTEEPPKQRTKVIKKEEFTNTFQKATQILEIEPLEFSYKQLETINALADYKVPDEMQELEEKIKSMIKVTDNFLAGYKSKKRVHVCVVCGKEGLYANIKTHIEANHIEGTSHPCNSCDKTFRCRNMLRRHTSSNHKIK